MGDDWEFRIARLALQEGDILVAKVAVGTVPEVMQHIGEFLKSMVPKGVRIGVIDDSIDLSVVGKPEAEG